MNLRKEIVKAAFENLRRKKEQDLYDEENWFHGPIQELAVPVNPPPIRFSTIAQRLEDRDLGLNNRLGDIGYGFIKFGYW